MKRPLLFPALAFAAGVLAAETTRSATEWFGLFAAAGLAISFRPRRIAGAGLLAAILGAGGLAYRAGQLPLDATDPRSLLAGQPAVGTVRGVLAEAPSIRLVERAGEWVERTVVRLRLTGWKPQGGDWETASGEVAVSSRGVPDARRFYRDQRVEISGTMSPPPGPIAPGLFDYATFLHRQGVGVQLLCEAPDDWATAAGALDGPPWDERFQSWARARLTRGLPDDTATRLILAMALGWRTGLAGDVDDVFMRSGTLHVFAISGLHIALIAGLLVGALRLLRLSTAACGLAALPLIWAYVGATGWQASAIRSAIMTSVIVGTWALERPGNLLNSLAAAALAVLVWQPGQLLQAGFLLSFTAVASLSLFQPGIEAWLLEHRPWKPDALLPASAWSWPTRLGETAARWLCSGAATGLAACAGTLPFTVHFFHLANPVSLLANLVVVPLSSLVLVANALSLALPVGTETWNAAAWAGMHGMAGFSRLCADLPGGWWYVASPPPAWWIPYAGLLLTAGEAPRERSWRRVWIAAGCAYGAAIACGWLVSERMSRITVFRSGEAIHVGRPWRSHDILIDCGDDVGVRSAVLPWLQAHGVNRPIRFAASHGDIRHVGGAERLFAEMPPRAVFLASGRMRSPSFRRIDDLARAAGIPHAPLRRGDRLAGMDVLHPDAADSFARADDQSLVVLGDVGGVRLLIAPDLGRAGQTALRARHGTNLAADILITGVPRDGSAAEDALLGLVRPRLVVIGSGKRPASERVSRAVRRRLRGREFHVLYTEDVGALEISAADGAVRVYDAAGGEFLRLDAARGQGRDTAR